jgi:hypothetical protein
MAQGVRLRINLRGRVVILRFLLYRSCRGLRPFALLNGGLGRTDFLRSYFSLRSRVVPCIGIAYGVALQSSNYILPFVLHNMQSFIWSSLVKLSLVMMWIIRQDVTHLLI